MKLMVKGVLGRIGLLWHNSIGATPVSVISSDRICAVRFSVDDGGSLLVSVRCVYAMLRPGFGVLKGSPDRT